MIDSPDWEIYRIAVHDIARYRDWPIRILTFTSALHFALLAALTIKELDLSSSIAFAISFGLLVIYGSTIYHFGHCHKEYLRLRNVQTKLNRKFGLDREIYPEKWFEERPVKLGEGLWGWVFYAIYATVLFALSLIVIWQIGFDWS
jgi:hypothetical protein